MAVVPVACAYRRSVNIAAASLLFGQPMSLQTAENAPRANPSIERTPYGMLRMPPVAAHVER
jgi:hypothetical protein